MSSARSTPQLNTSALLVYSSCRIISGAMYTYVPVSPVKHVALQPATRLVHHSISPLCQCTGEQSACITRAATRCAPGRGEAAREAHVSNAGAAGGVKEDVGGLEVAVQDGRLGRLQRLHPLRHAQRHGHLLLQTAPPRTPAREHSSHCLTFNSLPSSCRSEIHIYRDVTACRNILRVLRWQHLPALRMSHRSVSQQSRFCRCAELALA